MTIPPGHRFEATQALRQVLGRAVDWGMLDLNPAKVGVENPQRRYAEKRPFESWDELEAVAAVLGPRYGPLVISAAATGLRPGEWLALEHRDIDPDQHVLYVRRAYRNRRVKPPKTQASLRAVPLQTIALAALEQLPSAPHSRLGSRRRQAATSTCTTSATGTGDPLSAPRVSSRSGGSTTFGTRLRPSRSAPGSRPSTSPATWARASR